MRKLVAVLPLVWLATIAATTPTPTPTATPTPTQAPTPTPANPTPYGNVNLSAASAPSGTKINVSGMGFKPGEAIVVFLDTPDHALAPAWPTAPEPSTPA